VKDDNPQSPINAKPELTANGKSAAQNRWIAYNKMRGQYNSAMEHAVPEQFWVDKNQCRYIDETGTIKNPAMADCAQAVSAVKAIAIAQAEGQRIYTINQSNAATALAKLPVGGTVGQEIQSAIQAGKEVTVHERGINAHGFSGYGYIITDPETGGGAYLIEGKGNGGVFSDELVAKSMTMASLTPVAVGGGFDGAISKSIGLINNAMGYAGLVAGAWLSCNKDVIINLIALAIAMAIIVSVVKTPALAPVVGVVAILAIALSPSSAMAAKANDDCYLSCRFADRQILKNTLPEPIYGQEHQVKTDYGAIPNSKYDICACRNGSIVIWEHDMCGRIPIDIPPIITHYSW
jgi:hypothetical protein